MKKALRVAVLVMAIALSVAAYRHLFPSEDQRLHRLLSEVARVASIPTDPQPLGNLAAAQKLASFCSQDAEIHVAAPAYGQHSFVGRDEILQAALAARANLKGIKVEFVDISVRLDAQEQSAVAELTAKVTRTIERDLDVVELKLQLRKIDAQWRIIRIDTVRTLRL